MIPNSITGRDLCAYLCIQRGNTAPLVDLSMHVAGTNDIVPHGFQKVQKNLNIGNDVRPRQKMTPVYMCVRKQDMKLVDPQSPLETASGKAPISELKGVVGKDAATKLLAELPDAGCSPWSAVALPGTELTDLSQGRDRYLCYRHNPELHPITQIERVPSSNVPNIPRIRRQFDSLGLSAVEGEASPGVNMPINFAGTHLDRGHPTVYIGFSRKVGLPLYAGIACRHFQDKASLVGNFMTDEATQFISHQALPPRKGGDVTYLLAVEFDDVVGGTYTPTYAGGDDDDGGDVTESDDEGGGGGGAAAGSSSAKKKKSKAAKAPRALSGDPVPEAAGLLALKMLGKRSPPRMTIEVEGWYPITGVQVDKRNFVNTFILRPVEIPSLSN